MQIEQLNLTLPSGYEASESLDQIVKIDNTTLPWLKEPFEMTVSKCRLDSGREFLIASAIGTHSNLIEAAQGMNDGQRKATDNMFYSRLPEIILNQYSPNVETLENPITKFPIFVMRNKSGQRVYFARIQLDDLAEQQQLGPTNVRLAVCDKNKQKKALSVLSGMGSRQMHYKLSK